MASAATDHPWRPGLVLGRGDRGREISDLTTTRTELIQAVKPSSGWGPPHFRQAVGTIAAERKLELPDRTAAGIEDPGLAALQRASGEAFDRAFLARQLGVYRPMAELFQAMASNSPDPALQRLGITALAAVRAHFETARKLGEPMGLRVETVESPPQY